MIRRLGSVAACAVLAVACNGGGGTSTASPPPPTTPPASTSTPTAPVGGSSTVSPSAPTSPAPLSPSSTPEGAVLLDIPPATPAEDVDAVALAPEGHDVTGRWIGRVGAVEQLVVAVAGEGDAFARDRAVWRWTPARSLGGWLGVPLLEYPSRLGVLSIDAAVTDVTGDVNDDALIFALTGGSGACGTWTVVDLASARSIYRRDLCDGTIDPSTQPVGLLITESVYRAGDPHCCPSARRETVLTYDDDRWDVFRRETVAF